MIAKILARVIIELIIINKQNIRDVTYKKYIKMQNEAGIFEADIFHRSNLNSFLKNYGRNIWSAKH